MNGTLVAALRLLAIAVACGLGLFLQRFSPFRQAFTKTTSKPAL